jgi:hypothetical protein
MLKKLFLIVVMFLLFGTMVYSENLLGDYLGMELGLSFIWVPDGDFGFWKDSDERIQTELNNLFYLQFEVDVWLFNMFFIGGSTTIMTTLEAVSDWIPASIEDMLHAGLFIYPVTLFFECRHYIHHDVTMDNELINKVGVKVDLDIGAVPKRK